MPIYMDLHIVPGVKAKEAAEAHRLDILIEQEHHCKCMTYWIDEARGHVFCLIDAPDEEAVIAMHHEAHGLVPYKIIEVQSSIVESFLGRISDPPETEKTIDGLAYFNDPAFRVLMVCRVTDPVMLQYQLGKEKAAELVLCHRGIINEQMVLHDGREVSYPGPAFVGSFTSADNALACAMAITRLSGEESTAFLNLKIGLHGGEPLTANADFFQKTVDVAERICFISGKLIIGVSSTVRELIYKSFEPDGLVFVLTPGHESLMSSCFSILEKNWQNADFQIDDFSRAMSMSRSRLYRKITAMCRYTPNTLLQFFRLEKAREHMSKCLDNVSSVTYHSGFSSPSYFTKCFKKRYHIAPHTYLSLMK